MGSSVRQFGEINDVPELERVSVKCSYCALTNRLFRKRLSICIIQKTNNLLLCYLVSAAKTSRYAHIAAALAANAEKGKRPFSDWDGNGSHGERLIAL